MSYFSEDQGVSPNHRRNAVFGLVGTVVVLAVVLVALLLTACTTERAALSPPTTVAAEPLDSWSVETTEPPTTTTRPVRTTRAARSEVRRIPLAAPQGDVWAALARCESGLRQDAYNPAGPYYSYFQWLLGTWRSVGGTGDPRNASYEEQVSRAKVLQARSGWRQWPACARKLGLIA